MSEQSKRGNYRKNYEGTRRGLLVRLMLRYGLVTSNGLRVICEGTRTREWQKTLHTMEQEGIVGSVNTNRGSKAWFLKGVENRGQDYLEQMPLGTYKAYAKEGALYKKSVQLSDTKDNRRKRAIRSSDASVLMDMANIPVNPNVYTQAEDITFPSYYTMYAVKSLYQNSHPAEAEKTTYGIKAGIRALGAYCTATRMYPVYKLENKLIKLVSLDAEYGGISLLDTVLYGLNPSLDIQEKESCIFLVDDTSVIPRLIASPQTQRGYIDPYLLTIEQGLYNEVYVLPYSKAAQRHIQRMGSSPTWKEDLIVKVLGRDRLHLKDEKTQITCDGYHNGCHELVYCVSDLARLDRFLKAAKRTQDNKQFRLYCYEWQIPIVEMLTNNNEVQIINVKET